MNTIFHNSLVSTSFYNKQKQKQKKKAQKICAAPALPEARLTGGAEEMCWISPRFQ